MMQYLTIKEAGELALVSRWTIFRWIKAGLIHAVKNDGGICIDADSLRAFPDEQMTDTMKVKS